MADPATWAAIVAAAITAISELSKLLKKKDDPMEDARAMMANMSELGYPGTEGGGAPQSEEYQNPYLPQMGSAAFQMIMNQLKRTSNWGWPEGQGMDTSWLDDLLATAPYPSGAGKTSITTRAPAGADQGLGQIMDELGRAIRNQQNMPQAGTDLRLR